MNRLDRHIAWRYFINIAALFAALFSFIVAVDVFLNLRRFIDSAEGARPDASSFEHALVTCMLVVDLWGPRLLQLFNYMIGFVLVAAMGFTCANFVRHREFIAMLASGRSLRRLAWPIFAVAAMVMAAGAVNQELVLPRVAHLLPRNAGDAGQRSLASFRVPLVKDGAGRLFYAARYDDEAQAMERVSVWERSPEGGVLRRIWADRAVWDGAGWRLENGYAQASSAAAASGAGAIEGATGAHRRTPEPIERLETDLDPTRILVGQIQGYGQSLSWRQIDETLGHHGRIEAAARERLERIRYGRLSVIASNMLALAVALPFFLVREPKNMLAQSLKAAPLAMAALVGAAIGAAAPTPGLPVWLGVFIPALVLLPIAIWGGLSVKT